MPVFESFARLCKVKCRPGSGEANEPAFVKPSWRPVAECLLQATQTTGESPPDEFSRGHTITVSMVTIDESACAGLGLN